ncbi:type IV toxin-antitoxin system AbiEi family antitoxin domain-containing protein [Nocardioides alkalitolerans]|uniref:type IV toxin-antitoxin system AbiEi family antitoxin domain-containing protein n=1 Tax=Nocardioides alkalitolerans TaxID=281714 RepID=UPI000A0668E5|nr:type IV toxin-antitoxin system AbiEi family antitoxin domain-containing protein [Nocardioides alkalitolerans]
MSHTLDPRLAEAAARHGVFLRKEAVAAGYDDGQIAALVRRGTWHRVRHGAYVDGAVWAALDARHRHLTTARAAVRSAAVEVVASHVTSALAHGADTWNVTTDEVHLTRRDQRTGRREAGVVQHRGALGDEDVVTTNGLTHTSGTRAALEVASMPTIDLEHGLVVVNSLLHRGVTTVEKLAQAADEAAHWPYTLSIPRLLALADGRVETVGESRTLYLCHIERIPLPVPQVAITDHTGLVFARVDFAWPDLGVFLEFDGKIKYQGALVDGTDVTSVVLAEKRREERIIEATGWRVIRITWADLAHPERIAERIRTVLAAAARRAG